MTARLSAALLVWAACGAACSPAAEPLKVFILAGQSNMQGHALTGTFDAMALSPQTAPLLEAMRGPDGAPRVLDDVWISSLGGARDEAGERTGKLTAGFGAEGRGTKIGPEFTFGIALHEHLGEPILLIKTAWGGKSLHTDFRPPSAGPYEFNAGERERLVKQGRDLDEARAQKAEATGRDYRRMIAHVKKTLADVSRVVPDHDPAAGHELAGFVWFQGWNDMVAGDVYPNRGQPGGYDAYSDLLATFIRDVRTDLAAPNLPVVIGVLGVGGPVADYGPGQRRYAAIHQGFRDAMAAPAALPEFAGTVAAVRTEQFWDMEVAALRTREHDTVREPRKAIEAAMKAGETPRAEGAAAIEVLYAAEFTPRELTLLRDSVSNAEYHYLGSARIMAPIGKAFADALFGLIKMPG